jgi:serine/threonine protein phosphatase PrpC
MTYTSNYRLNLSYNYLKAAWNGESPSCKLSPLARQVLDPSCYRYSLLGRAALALRGITLPLPVIGTISDYATNYLKQHNFQTKLATAPAYMDEEFRTFTNANLVSQKIKQESVAAAKEGESNRSPLSQFASIAQESGHPLPEHESTTLMYNGKPLHVTTAWAQGVRQEMEDEHMAASFKVRSQNKELDAAIFGIFDGHAGNGSCKFVKQNFIKVFKYYLERQGKVSNLTIFNALKITFVDLSIRFAGSSGTCASVALLLNHNLWVANAGDSRVVLDRAGETQQLSRDAKPDHMPFQKSVENRGGGVTRKIDLQTGHISICRVNGQLGVARAIGDHDIVGETGFGCASPRPKITGVCLRSLKPNSHLFLGCDGLWDVATSEEVVNAKKSAPELVSAALRANSTDNVSVMTVDLSALGTRE